jgi:isopenicillin-N epimerase
VPGLGVDWYVGNLHKWAFAAKGTGVLWCAPERQSALHPVAISHALGQGFAAEFDYTGTRDNSAWLAVPAALDYLEGLGAAAVRDHNRALATAAGDMLAEAWGGDIAAAAEFRGAMAAVRLPGRLAGDHAAAARLTERLREEFAVSAPVMVLDGALWLRLSAQVYNEETDYRQLAEIGRRLGR